MRHSQGDILDDHIEKTRMYSEKGKGWSIHILSLKQNVHFKVDI